MEFSEAAEVGECKKQSGAGGRSISSWSSRRRTGVRQAAGILVGSVQKICSMARVVVQEAASGAYAARSEARRAGGSITSARGGWYRAGDEDRQR